ncbi:MAG: hypothetical protein BA863_01325 [Desulfovibrio sp. S3730MH75]|nr:MAG: hypothetical protein BA863_01325 [Desulfovibrio sp. S3730MH75]
MDNIFALGAGKTGEYLGKEIGLVMAGGEVIDGAGGTIHTTTVTYPERAFDGNPATYAYDGGTPEWPFLLGKQWDAPKLVKNVEVKGASIGFANSATTPASVDMYLEGSSDGANWDVLGSVLDTANGPDYVTVDVPYDGNTQYLYHRIRIEDPSGAGNGAVNSTISSIIFSAGAPSTTSTIVTESTASTKDKQFIDGGLHNNLACTMADGSVVEAKVASVSEEVVLGVEQETIVQPHVNTSAFGGCIIEAKTPLAAGTVISALGGTGSAGTELAFGITKQLADIHNHEIVVRTGTHTIAVLGEFEYEAVDYTVPDDGNTYYLCVFHISGAIGYADNGATGVQYAASSVASVVGDSIVSASTTTMPAYAYKSATPDGVKTTAILTEAQVDVPVGVAIPDRYTHSATEITSVVLSDRLVLSSNKVVLPDNAELKQIAMAVRASGDMCFTDGKIYIQETM